MIRLRQDFKNSALMQNAKAGKREPVGNLGLQQWVETIYSIWTDYLKRSTENKRDGINGRKYLLEFMSDCMAYLNPEIEYNTLDNMLRKVQNRG